MLVELLSCLLRVGKELKLQQEQQAPQPCCVPGGASCWPRIPSSPATCCYPAAAMPFCCYTRSPSSSSSWSWPSWAWPEWPQQLRWSRWPSLPTWASPSYWWSSFWWWWYSR